MLFSRTPEAAAGYAQAVMWSEISGKVQLVEKQKITGRSMPTAIQAETTPGTSSSEDIRVLRLLEKIKPTPPVTFYQDGILRAVVMPMKE